MPNYQVKATNKRGYTQESDVYASYNNALCYALECKDSGQYKVVVILKEDEYDVNRGKFFLHRIIL